MAQGWWKSDQFVGVGVFLGLTLMVMMGWTGLEKVEYAVYDAAVSASSGVDEANDVVLVTIDDPSIARMGRWPWPRDLLAEGIDRIQSARPRVIGLDILLSEPDRNPGLAALKGLSEELPPILQEGQVQPETAQAVMGKVTDWSNKIDYDQRLAKSLSDAGDVVLPMYFALSPKATQGGELPQWMDGLAIGDVSVPPDIIGANWSAQRADPPIELFGNTVLETGHLNVVLDSDNAYRSDLVAVNWGGSYVPSFSVALAAAYMGLSVQDLSLEKGVGLYMDSTYLPLTPDNRVYFPYFGKMDAFTHISYADLLRGDVPESTFRDRVVLVGMTANGLSDRNLTPLGDNLDNMVIIANSVESLIQGKVNVRPDWGAMVKWGLWLLVGIFVAFGLPRLKAGMGAAISATLFVILLGTGFFVLLSQNLWLETATPASLLFFGYTILVSKRFFSTEKHKEIAEIGAQQDNKMLGLSYQAQGQLDMAFSAFRKVPVGHVKDELYNLGLDFERKRQFAKAAAVYEHIFETMPDFKDVSARSKRLKQAEETMIFGLGGGGGGGGLVLSEDGATRPTLGRYEIMKELGKGAMGVVYLGEDPTIHRKVAIKTMRLAEEFEAEDLKEVKERFFREAETAGRLNHPNIVTIFDAGEDQDLAYIAMELLDGHEITVLVKKYQQGMPVAAALKIVLSVADALDYADQNEVGHRDIKPANIMILKDGTVKVTDFGIARITSSSRTKTGVVLGTPSYMSPEQVAGKHVDGRSDIFSLGVVLFELLTGKKPFSGDSMATLMYQIANEEPITLDALRPGLPQCTQAIVKKALEKKVENRYQRASEMANDIKRCMAQIAAQRKSAEAAPEGDA